MNEEPSKNRRILLIDDSERIHEDFRTILENNDSDHDALSKAREAIFGSVSNSSKQTNFEIDSALQGQDGLEKVRQALQEGRPYAMAFVDIRMPPGWDGVETIKRIWDEYPELEVVICTAYSDYNWKDIVAQLGQTDRLLILKKPFDNMEVYQLACALTEKWHLCQQAKAKIKTSETKYRILYESSKEAIMTLAPPGWNFISGNPATIKLFDSENEAEFISLGPWDISPEHQPDGELSAVKARKMIEKAMNEGSNFFEWTHKRVNGEEFPATVSLTRMELEGRQLLQAVVRDITELKQSQKEISDLARFPKENPNPVMRISNEGVVLFTNDACKPVLETWESEQGQHLLENCYKRIEEVIRSGKSSRFEFECSNGQIFLFILAPVTESGYVNVYGLDITKRKQAETKLRHAAEEWKTTFDTITDMVSIHDKNFTIIRANKSFAKNFNMTPSEIIGKKCCNLMHGTDKPPSYCPHDEAIKTGKSCCKEYYESRLGIYIEVSSSPLFDENNQVIGSVHIANDITKRKQSEELVQQARKQAETGSEAKSQFLANMSHEIRTPLNSVIGFSEVLSQENLTEEQKKYVNLIWKSGKNLMRIINDILDFSKIEAGKLEIDIIECSVSEILDNINELLCPMAQNKALDFKILQADGLPDRICTDPERLHQCLTNLVSNAIKFTEKGHVYLHVIMEQNSENEPRICFNVEDTGIGIKSQDSEKVFKSFTQADGSTSRKYGGTGLGLAITRRLAKLLGGKLTLASEAGKGSTFSLVIPIGLDPIKSMNVDTNVTIKEINKDDDKSKQSKLSGHVLVAEDVETNQVLARALLNRMGLEVTIAADGHEAVQNVLAQEYDLIFMDIQMPGMDGYQATKALRKEGIQTPIIALTAHAMKGDDKKCIEAGCNDYMTKPLDSRILAEKVQKYLQPVDNTLSKKANTIKSQVDELTKMCSESVAQESNLKESAGVEDIKVILNWEELIGRLGDEELISEIVPIFLKDNKERLEMLTTAVETGDAKAIKSLAHAVKGAGRNIGAKQLSDIAHHLERVGRDNNLESAVSVFDELKLELEKVIKFLSRKDWIEIAKREKVITDEMVISQTL